jgi:ABC-type multidrug transport system ATPase subunit
MLCLAGLLRPDAGEIRWFGEIDRGSAVRRALYHLSPADLMRQGSMNEPHIHLIDLRDGQTHVAHLNSWIGTRLAAGDSVVIASRTLDTAVQYASRVVMLRHGVLAERSRVRARVAEFSATAGSHGPT